MGLVSFNILKIYKLIFLAPYVCMRAAACNFLFGFKSCIIAVKLSAFREKMNKIFKRGISNKKMKHSCLRIKY